MPDASVVNVLRPNVFKGLAIMAALAAVGIFIGARSFNRAIA